MIVIVGDKPSDKMTGRVPFEGAACKLRVLSWINTIDIKEYIIVNSCDHTQDWFLLGTLAGHIYITLGAEASKVLKNIPHFKLPHPSGLNRQINDQSYVDRKLQECKEWLKLYCY